MASYNATINLSVAGASQLDRVLARVSELDALARRLSTNPINVFGRGTAGDIARTALKPFQDISRAIENGASAAANSVAKTNLLASTFKTLASNVKIASKEYDDFIRVAGRAAAAAETQNKALETTIDAERRAALGLQPQDVRDFEVARRKTFVENERRQRALTKEALQDEIQLQEALLRLEEKSAAIANAELQARGEIAQQTARGVNAAAFRAAQTGVPQLALPAFQERGLQLLDNSVKLNESQLRLETALNGQRARGVRYLEKQTAEEERQFRLGLLGERTNQLPGRGSFGRGLVPPSGFPVAGPLQSPGFQRTQKQVGKFGENLALGAGFPLLFGGGPGAIAGSVLGSFFGSGFGGQILGGAIGQILDQAIQKTAQLGSAIQTLDLSKVEESGVRINSNIETQISLLRQVSDAYGAQQVLQQEIYAATGALPGTVEGISDSVNVLSSAWAEFTAAAGVTLGIIGAPFAAALGAALRLVNLILKGFNLVLSAIGGAIKLTGEWIVELVAGEKALKNIKDYFTSLNSAIDESRAKYAPILANLNGQVLLGRELIDLEKQKTAGITTNDKIRNVNLNYQQKILRINADIDEEIRETNKDITNYNKDQVNEKVRFLNILRSQRTEEAQIEAALERQRIAEQAREKAAQEALKARREAERLFKEQVSAANLLFDVQTETARAAFQTTEITAGQQAALRQRIEYAQDLEEIEIRRLNNERQVALQDAAAAGTTELVNALYGRREALIRITYATQKAQNQLELKNLKLLEDQQRIEEQRQRDTTLRGLGREIERLQIETTLNTDVTGIETATQLFVLEQRNRIYDELVPTLNSIADIEKKIKEGGLTTEQLNIEQGRLTAQQQYLVELQNELNIRSELEQQQFRMLRLTEQLQPIATGVGDAFSNSFKGIINGSMTAQESLAGFFQSVADSFLDMAAQIIQKWIQMTILNSILKLFPGGGGGGGLSDLGAPATISNPLGILEGRATGGPVMSGSPYIVGERGPELFVPGRSGTIVPNEKMGGVGGTTNVVVNVDAKGSSVQGDDGRANELGRVVSAAVQSEIIKQQRPGGLLAGTR